MSIVDDVTAAATEVAQAATAELRAQAVLMGLPRELAKTVSLEWDGATFVATSSNPRMYNAEYGDGTAPVRSPIRKALNRMRPALTAQLQQRIDAVAVPQGRF